MQISVNQNIPSVRDLIFIISQTLFNFMFTGFMLFGKTPIFLNVSRLIKKLGFLFSAYFFPKASYSFLEKIKWTML